MKKIVLDKSAVLGLFECMNSNLDRLHTAIAYYVPDPGAANVMRSRIDEMRYYLKGVYDPEFVDMKAHLRLLYQKWLVLKKTDPTTARVVYLEYLKLKSQIQDMEYPPF